MKTTIEISDDLLRRAKACAVSENTTLRALVERGLRQVLKGRHRRGKFRLRDASVGGDGLQGNFEGADWAAIREAAYEGRGS